MFSIIGNGYQEIGTSLYGQQARQTSKASVTGGQTPDASASVDSVSGSARRTLIDELKDAWPGVAVGVTPSTSAAGCKSFAMNMVRAGCERSVGISPEALQRLQEDPEFKAQVTQSVSEHLEVFDQNFSTSPQKKTTYGLLVDAEGNISSWSYTESSSSDDDKKDIRWEGKREAKQAVKKKEHPQNSPSEISDTEDVRDDTATESPELYERDNTPPSTAVIVDITV